MKQLTFEQLPKVQKSFGGELSVGKRKSARPLSTKDFLNYTLSLEDIPNNESRKISFFKHFNEVQEILYAISQKYGVQIHKSSINWTHLHTLISFGSRQQYIRFTKVLNSKLVGFLQSKSDHKLTKPLKLRPFTRVVHWGKDYERFVRYLDTNELEAEGAITARRF